MIVALLLAWLAGCALGCSVTTDVDRALVDARRSELVLTREITASLREASAVTSEAAALVSETRPRVARVLDDAGATTREIRERAWLPWACCAALFGAVVANVFRRRPT